MVLYYGNYNEQSVLRILSSGFTAEEEGYYVSLADSYYRYVREEKQDEFVCYVIEIAVELAEADIREHADYAGFLPGVREYSIPVDLLQQASPRMRLVGEFELRSPQHIKAYADWQQLKLDPGGYERRWPRSKQDG